jgi:beta-lactamase regulating signal transducer with metallopeptidase domain
LIRVLIPNRPARPPTVLEAVTLPGGQFDIAILPNPEVLLLPNSVPITAIWLAGMFLWVGARAFAWARFNTSLKACASRCDAPAGVVALLPDRLRNFDTRFFSCSLPGAPFVTGFLRPSVYLPEDFEDRFNASERKCIVHHELMHFSRRDIWMQAAWEAIRMVFWFNPIIHIAAIALRDDQEFACDHDVLISCGGDERFHYARALLTGAGPFLLPRTLAFFSRPTERFVMLEKHHRSKIRNIAGLFLCSVVGVFALTRAPLSMAQQGLEEPITLNFPSIPIEKVIGLFADLSGETIEGIDQIAGSIITIHITGVPARDVLTQLLNCVGYTIEPSGEVLEIVPLSSPSHASFECLDVDFEADRTV